MIPKKPKEPEPFFENATLCTFCGKPIKNKSEAVLVGTMRNDIPLEYYHIKCYKEELKKS